MPVYYMNTTCTRGLDPAPTKNWAVSLKYKNECLNKLALSNSLELFKERLLDELRTLENTVFVEGFETSTYTQPMVTTLNS